MSLAQRPQYWTCHSHGALANGAHHSRRCSTAHLDVDIVLVPLLGLKLAPFKVTLDRLFVVSEPSLPFK